MPKNPTYDPYRAESERSKYASRKYETDEESSFERYKVREQGITASVRELSTLARETLGEERADWRAAVSGVSKLEASRQAGDIKSYRDTLLEILKLDIEGQPIDDRAIELAVQYVDRGGGSYENRSKAIWGEFLKATPVANAKTAATLRELQRITGMDPHDAVGPQDKDGVFENLVHLEKVAAEQDAAASRLATFRRQAEGAVKAIDGNPEIETREEFDRLMAPFDILSDSAAMGTIKQFVQDKADEPLVYEGETAIAAQYLKDNIARLSGESPSLAAIDKSAERLYLAKLVAMPAFQWWAKAHGYEIGTSDGTVAGYDPGPQDVKAAQFAIAQGTRTSDQHDLRSPLGGEQKVYGRILVKPKDAVAAADGKYYKQGNRYLSMEEVSALGGDASATYTWVNNAGVSEVLAPDTLSAMRTDAAAAGMPFDEFMAEVGVTRTAAPLDPAALTAKGIQVLDVPEPEMLNGELVGPTFGPDPIGSFRVVTKDGERLVTAEELEEPPRVTSGGGPKQTVARFFEVAYDRTAANKEEKGRDKSDRVPGTYRNTGAEALAAVVVPLKEGNQTKEEKNVITDAEAELLQRAVATAANTGQEAEPGLSAKEMLEASIAVAEGTPEAYKQRRALVIENERKAKEAQRAVEVEGAAGQKAHQRRQALAEKEAADLQNDLQPTTPVPVPLRQGVVPASLVAPPLPEKERYPKTIKRGAASGAKAWVPQSTEEASEQGTKEQTRPDKPEAARTQPITPTAQDVAPEAGDPGSPVRIPRRRTQREELLR